MHDITTIEFIKTYQGWTTTTLLKLALDFITANKKRSAAFVSHIESVAREENQQETRSRR